MQGQPTMNPDYIRTIQSISLNQLYELPHTYKAAPPTGIVVLTNDTVTPFLFPFTVCPLLYCNDKDKLAGTNPNDIILPWSQSDGSLEEILYKVYQKYLDTSCNEFENTKKRYVWTKKNIHRKIVIPTYGRLYNLECVLRRFEMIDLPVEGYRPPILVVEHSPNPEFENLCKKYKVEWLWFPLDPRNPAIPIGQFNKALCYDKAFLFTAPADWYLFHDNDVLVPQKFWNLIDENYQRTNAKFIQPYTHRCLIGLKENVAETFRKDLTLVDKPIAKEDYNEILGGAPGGSLYIHRDRYFEVGGHDPNFCWGWGPEDRLFYHKLSLCEPIAFADFPPIEMIHLWHPYAAGNNPFQESMAFLVFGYLMRKSNEEMLVYFKEKRDIFTKYLNNL